MDNEIFWNTKWLIADVLYVWLNWLTIRSTIVSILIQPFYTFIFQTHPKHWWWVLNIFLNGFILTSGQLILDIFRWLFVSLYDNTKISPFVSCTFVALFILVIWSHAWPFTVDDDDHRWTIRIVLYWNTIPKAGIVLVLVDFSKLSNTNTKPIPTKVPIQKYIAGNIVHYSINDWHKNTANNNILHVSSQYITLVFQSHSKDSYWS